MAARKPPYPTLLELIRGRARRTTLAGSSAAVIAMVGYCGGGGEEIWNPPLLDGVIPYDHWDTHIEDVADTGGPEVIADIISPDPSGVGDWGLVLDEGKEAAMEVTAVDEDLVPPGMGVDTGSFPPDAGDQE